MPENSKKLKCVLFDLDGTLLDTAPDLIHCLNLLREANHLPPFSLTDMKWLAAQGSKEMVKHALSITETHAQFQNFRQQFILSYEKRIASQTQFFPDILMVLNYLDQHNIPWGIVTNKLTRHTMELLKALKVDHRPGCIVCGDSLTTYKPDPAPIIHACRMLNTTPQECVYIGDAATDVIASKAAGTKSLVALYGYIPQHEDPLSWAADGYISHPKEIIDWLKGELAITLI